MSEQQGAIYRLFNKGTWHFVYDMQVRRSKEACRTRFLHNRQVNFSPQGGEEIRDIKESSGIKEKDANVHTSSLPAAHACGITATTISQI